MPTPTFNPPLTADGEAFYGHIIKPLETAITNVEGNARLRAEDREAITGHIKSAISATERAVQMLAARERS